MEDSIKFKLHQTSCCDPFNRHKKKITKAIRRVTKEMAQKYQKYNLTIDQQICDNCRNELSQSEYSSSSSNCNSDTQSIQSLEDKSYVEPDIELQNLNESLATINESPIKRIKLETDFRYSDRKTYKIQKRIEETIQKISPHCTTTDKSTSSKQLNSDETEMIAQLKAKFMKTEKRSEKLQILTILPHSWSTSKLKRTFGITNYMATQAKKLISEGGVLAMPSKTSRSLPQQTVDQITQFYKKENVSRIMPGRKDYKTVRKGGIRLQEQKYLILCNLKEAYKLFQETYPETKVGFSKFADLRPKECIIAGASGTHNVCVCLIHQNVKLMIYGSGMDNITKEKKLHLKTYNNCLEAILCNTPSYDCHFGNCLHCVNLIADLESYLKDTFNNYGIDDVQYKQWLAVDRTTLEEIIKPSNEFIEAFINALRKLREHDFITKEQSNFFSAKKSSLKEQEVLVTCDFSENYAFILQDAPQGFHWNNAQATLHPFVCYYMDSNTLKHVNVVVISDCLKHDTVAVHLFQRKLINFLKSYFSQPLITHMIYFSDGAVSQYKNFKNFTNLCFHEEDFGITAEWHFFSTSHGKGACDGLGGTIKRLATIASLQRPYNEQIMTPKQLFLYATENISGINFLYSSNKEYTKEASDLEERFASGSTIKGTHKLHCFVPISKTQIEVKPISNKNQGEKIVKVINKNKDIELHEIRGFVTVRYDQEWWLACVLNTLPDTDEVKVTFLHPKGPSPSFNYPSTPDILTVPYSNILNIVDPLTETGRSYKLEDKVMEEATSILNKVNLK